MENFSKPSGAAIPEESLFFSEKPSLSTPAKRPK
jgi:hypothetical protein